MTRIAILVFVLGCFGEHPSKATQPTPPTTPPAERVDAAIGRWAEALERGDDRALAEAQDGDGQFSLAYGAIKLASTHVDGGEQAVESTVMLLVLQAIFPGWFGPPDAFLAVLPPGVELAPALVAAGVASASDDGRVVAIPGGLERLAAAQREHRDRLRAGRAWTCKATAIEGTVLPSEPSLVRMAQVSTNIMAGWLQRVERMWLVRGGCDGGARALFVVTAFLDGSDRVLVATLQ